MINFRKFLMCWFIITIAVFSWEAVSVVAACDKQWVGSGEYVASPSDCKNICYDDNYRECSPSYVAQGNDYWCSYQEYTCVSGGPYLYQYSNSNLMDHMYTVVRDDDWFSERGYDYDGIACRMGSVGGTPDEKFKLKRYDNLKNGHHLYTYSDIDNPDYLYMGKLYYRNDSDYPVKVFSPGFDDFRVKRINRYINPLTGDRIYTPFRDDNFYGSYGYIFEKIGFSADMPTTSDVTIRRIAPQFKRRVIDITPIISLLLLH